MTQEAARKTAQGTADGAERTAALVGVIVPVYNGESYLQECIDSVLSQTFRDLELWLIDDGSRDGSSTGYKGPRHSQEERRTDGNLDSRRHGVQGSVSVLSRLRWLAGARLSGEDDGEPCGRQCIWEAGDLRRLCH